jgi:hypothetical protein
MNLVAGSDHPPLLPPWTVPSMLEKVLSRGVLLSCFILLQGADFLLTWLLVGSGHRTDVYEANPAALSILSRFGWAGLGMYKLAFTVIAAGAVLLVWQRRATTGRRLACFLCLAMLTVVGYSGVLLSRPQDPVVASIPALKARDSAISWQIEQLQHFMRQRNAISQDLLTGKIDCHQAIARMAELIQVGSASLARHHRSVMPRPDRPTELASYLYHHTSRLATDHPRWGARLTELRRELAEGYPAARFLAGFNERGEPNPWTPVVATTSNRGI